jgi:hypothetical protein
LQELIMRRFSSLLVGVVGVFASVPVALAAGGPPEDVPVGPRAGVPPIFRAHLTGAGEVPPVEDTLAQGQAIFRVARSGLQHRVNVAHIENVVAAHVHCAPEGVNGPVGLTLFTGGPTSLNGTLSSGPITGPDPGNACGWLDLDDVIAAMESGDTYVNVHTTQNTGGEIRGQLE